MIELQETDDTRRHFVKNRIREAIIPALITLAVFLGVLVLKGIFPFGPERIDYYDMGQTNAPLYYHIWDFLHGRSGLFYTWYINQGQNLSMGSSIQWNISVFNLFFLLIPRNSVMQSLSLFMGLHLFFMSFNMDLLLQKIVPEKKEGTASRILMSISYGLCGYTLTHYTIPTYLDTAALMPLYLLTLAEVLRPRTSENSEKEILSKNRRDVLIYALATGYMTALSYYLAYMDLIFILVISGTYIFLLIPKKTDTGDITRGHAAFRLGIGTFSGLGLSAFMLVPAAMQMSRSSRFQSNLEKTPLDTIKEILWAIGADMYYIKWWALAGSLLACAAIAIGVLKYRRDRRINVFWILVCFYPCSLIPFESINLIIHMGTYYHYPIRCGYWIPLTLLTAGAYYMSRLIPHKADSKKHKPGLLLFPAVLLLIAGAAVVIYYDRHDVWDVRDLFSAWLVFALCLCLVYAAVLLFIKDIRLVACVLAMELICGAYIGYGMPHFTDSHASGPEQSGDYVMTAMQLKDELKIPDSRTDRIKNPDTELNTNYGMVMDRATIGGWANTMPRPQMDHAGSLGYTLHFMRVMDSGGTIFSDALLHVTQTLTHERFYCDNDAYSLKNDNGGYYLYDNRYTLPFAIPVSSELTYMDADYDVVKTHNRYYHALSGSDADIFADAGVPESTSIDISGRKALYLGGGSATQITVNGKQIPVPSLGQPDNTSYPTEFNGALIFAGLYEDEPADIQGFTGGRAYLLDLDALEKLCDTYKDLYQTVTTSRSGLEIEVSGSDDKDMALIPMSYDPGLTATVNGTEQDIRNIDDIFIGIPIQPGSNTISVRFRPVGMVPGLVISLLTLTLLSAAIALTDIRHLSCMYSFSLVVLRILWLAVLIVIYVIPLAAFVIHQFQKRLL